MWMQIAAKVASLPDVVLGRVLSELLTRWQTPRLNTPMLPSDKVSL